MLSPCSGRYPRDLGQRYRHDLSDPRLARLSQPRVDDFGWRLASRRVATEPSPDAVDDRAILPGRPASTIVLWLDGKQIFQNTPFRFSEIALAQVPKSSVESTSMCYANRYVVRQAKIFGNFYLPRQASLWPSSS